MFRHPRLLIVLTNIVVSFVLGCTTLPSRTVVFEGTAMLPGIKSGTRLPVLMLTPQSKTQLKRGDIVVFRHPEDPAKQFIQRLIGLPGDTVTISSGDVWINDVQLQEPYIDARLNVSKRSLPSMEVPRNSYFLMADNRDNAADSRIWGFVPEDHVIAKVDQAKR